MPEYWVQKMLNYRVGKNAGCIKVLQSLQVFLEIHKYYRKPSAFGHSMDTLRLQPIVQMSSLLSCTYSRKPLGFKTLQHTHHVHYTR